MMVIKEDLVKRGMSEKEAEDLINKSKASLQAHFDKENIDSSIEEYFDIKLGNLKKLAMEAREKYIELRKILIEIQESTRKAKEYYEALDKSLAFLDGRFCVVEVKEEKKKKKRKLSKEELLDILAYLEKE